MKDKLLYSLVFVLVVAGASLSLSQVESASLFSSEKLKHSSINVSGAPDHVQRDMDELEQKYPHVTDICIYGSAMIMNGLANEIGSALDAESKCIHTMVINESKDKEQARFALAAATSAE